MYATNDMEIDGHGALIMANAFHHPIKAMPSMNLGNTDKMKSLTPCLLQMQMMQRNAIKIDTITDVNSSLSENLLSIREGYHRIHLLVETMTEQLIDLQSQTLFEGTACKLLIIGISRYFCNGADACLLQLFKETYQPWIGILKATGIDKPDAFLHTIIIYTVVTKPLAKRSQFSFSIVLKHCFVNKAASMTFRAKVIIAQTYIVTVLLQPLHLVVNLLGYTTVFRKAMIDKEQYLHTRPIYYVI